MRNRERRWLRDRGLSSIGAWTRGVLAGGVALSGVLAAAFAWTAPGRSAKAEPGPASDDRSPASSIAPPTAPGTAPTTRVSSPGHRHTARPALTPPVQPVRPTTRPRATTSGGS